MNSRTLHEELGIKTKHADWIARKIALLDLEEGEDYIAGERKDCTLSEEAVAWIRASTSKEELKEMASTGAVNGVTESYYKDSKGRRQPVLYLNEHACLAVLARYSAGFRAILSHKFLQYRSALVKYLQAETVAKHIPQKPLSRRYVYIIENIFKVGITTDVARRLATFQTGCDGELSVYYESLVCSNAKNIEAEIHNHFREYKIREGIGREWFSSKLDKLEIIDYLKEQNYVLESSFGEEYE